MNHILIAGYGYIGKVHADCADLPVDFLVRHLPEPVPEHISFFTDYKSAIKNRPLFFDICTPNMSHKELALQALRDGLPVYCEKPLAANAEDAELLSNAAGDIPNGMAFNYRFLPCIQMLRQALQSGAYGKIIYYTGSFLHDSYILPRPKSWRTMKETGGGALADLGIHLFDLCRHIFGEASVSACEKHTEFPERAEVDEYARVTLQHELCKGYLEISRISAGKREQSGIEVFTHHGRLSVMFARPYEMEYYDIKSKSTTIFTADDELLSFLNFPTVKFDMGMFYGSHKATIVSFTKSVQSGQPHSILATFKDGAAAQKILTETLKT